MSRRIRELIVGMNDSIILGFLFLLFFEVFWCFNIRAFKRWYVTTAINAFIGMATYIRDTRLYEIRIFQIIYYLIPSIYHPSTP